MTIALSAVQCLLQNMATKGTNARAAAANSGTIVAAAFALDDVADAPCDAAEPPEVVTAAAAFDPDPAPVPEL